MDYDNEEIKEININKRFEIGKREYGQGLKVDDGHEWVTETLEEILDSLIYTSAKIIKLTG